ncbi:MAG: hypothetical protein FWF56_02285 [Firmicutes bacterium]|nr:hypothetical protein [Bacillota bacterium]MCL1953825.1 hypothetical protein [Bacillota bacterium]
MTKEDWRKLQTMGASWFVSYKYYNHIEKQHTNFCNAKNTQSRESAYNNSTKFHKQFLEKVLEMNDNSLNLNRINLRANQIKQMAKELLEILP